MKGCRAEEWHRAETIIDEEEEPEEKESLAKAVAITHSEKVTKELHEQFKHLASRESVGKMESRSDILFAKFLLPYSRQLY